MNGRRSIYMKCSFNWLNIYQQSENWNDREMLYDYLWINFREIVEICNFWRSEKWTKKRVQYTMYRGTSEVDACFSNVHLNDSIDSTKIHLLKKTLHVHIYSMIVWLVHSCSIIRFQHLNLLFLCIEWKNLIKTQNIKWTRWVRNQHTKWL